MSTIRIRQTRREDFPALIALQTRIYPTIPPWNRIDLLTQLEMFPQGQIVAEDETGLLGCASSIMVAWDDWAEEHNWHEITSAGTFDNHNPDGRTLYGVEVFVDPESQGQGVGHLLYEGFSYCGVMPDYIPEDVESCGFASLRVWLNPDYEPDKATVIRDDISFQIRF